MIMLGNIQGIALSAFLSRLKGKPIAKTGLLYELGMTLSQIVFLPIACVHSLISGIARKPLVG